jgi:hypothetical protein
MNRYMIFVTDIDPPGHYKPNNNVFFSAYWMNVVTDKLWVTNIGYGARWIELDIALSMGYRQHRMTIKKIKEIMGYG